MIDNTCQGDNENKRNQTQNNNQEFQQNLNKKFEPGYQLIKQKIIKLDFCSAITFNKESTIMLLGHQRSIKVYDFNQGVLEEKQNIITRKHGCSQSLYFMQHSQQFVSAGSEKTILIFALDKQGIWFCYQNIYEGHCAVNCVIMNSDESLLISCNNLNEIKFRKKVEKNFIEIQTLKYHKDHVVSICLNKAENYLISCADDKRIIVSQQKFNKIWVKRQVIQIGDQCSQICFIQDNIFTFYLQRLGKIILFEIQENQLFQKKQQYNVPKSKVDIIFHKATYNEGQGILLSKNGCHLSLISFKQEFQILQQICFQESSIAAAMTSNYLVTWDVGSKKIQVRRQQ